jgi:hypothetical protein
MNGKNLHFSVRQEKKKKTVSSYQNKIYLGIWRKIPSPLITASVHTDAFK